MLDFVDVGTVGPDKDMLRKENSLEGVLAD